MTNRDELRHQPEEHLKKEQEKERITKEEKGRDDNILKQKFTPDNPTPKEDQNLSKNNTQASPHAPIFPCVKCLRSHRKGQPCKAP
jgi:hypothetical protein